MRGKLAIALGLVLASSFAFAATPTWTYKSDKELKWHQVTPLATL